MGGFRSLSDYGDNAGVLGAIAVLIVLGGLGYAIVGDVVDKRRWSRFALETKIVVLTSIALAVGGALAIGAFEWSNPPTLGALPEAQRPLNALFESVTLRTAGFSALDTSGARRGVAVRRHGPDVHRWRLGLDGRRHQDQHLQHPARGDRVDRARPAVGQAFGRRIQHILIYRALSVALLSIAIAFGVGLLLELTTPRRRRSSRSCSNPSRRSGRSAHRRGSRRRSRRRPDRRHRGDVHGPARAADPRPGPDRPRATRRGPARRRIHAHRMINR